MRSRQSPSSHPSDGATVCVLACLGVVCVTVCVREGVWRGWDCWKCVCLPCFFSVDELGADGGGTGGSVSGSVTGGSETILRDPVTWFRKMASYCPVVARTTSADAGVCLKCGGGHESLASIVWNE